MSNDAPKLDYRDPEWVADQLGIDKNTVYRYLQDGSLPGLQLGRKWLISERRLADFLERVERQQTERRRSQTSGSQRPFALPERIAFDSEGAGQQKEGTGERPAAERHPNGH
jgi:excisionase family DNA binding protein